MDRASPRFDSLANRQAVVTGAGRGIGRAIALGLAAAGARVIAVARTQSDLDDLADRSDGKIVGWCEDVTTESFYERLEALDTLHVLVTNAGTNRPLPIERVDRATLDSMLTLNILSVFRTSQSGVRVMLRHGQGGSIIHISSQMGHVGAPLRTVYCMTKHAIEGLSKAMAVELGPSGIRVNTVAPTFVETDLTRSMLEEPSFRKSVLDNIPLGRIGRPEDIVGAVLFLASDAAGLISGDSLKVDGGWTAR